MAFDPGAAVVARDDTLAGSLDVAMDTELGRGGILASPRGLTLSRAPRHVWQVMSWLSYAFVTRASLLTRSALP